ncbi:hypothetical protein CONLIGDRAFT_195813 [Coniochaeta ligniaria NRRL 30616]|uniref:Uncharacterized protein n=1 Tax=Coniochaeta ligniaria NRRL 30616 TaxID=1408157 RepID=A0A1J7JKB6_9PEZI|nr:hypothetical protein CONLIGDRAFT_195813 [Coniochaeta ligniaria NRRL 30616]
MVPTTPTYSRHPGNLEATPVLLSTCQRESGVGSCSSVPGSRQPIQLVEGLQSSLSAAHQVSFFILTLLIRHPLIIVFYETSSILQTLRLFSSYIPSLLLAKYLSYSRRFSPIASLHQLGSLSFYIASSERSSLARSPIPKERKPHTGIYIAQVLIRIESPQQPNPVR